MRMINDVGIHDHLVCKDCGCHPITITTNAEMQTFEDAGNHDWWIYCPNKACKNHHGEGEDQFNPEWTEWIDQIESEEE